MNILQRFGNIIEANINALLDKADDPEKKIEQYLLEALEDLAEVKAETASVMAEETRTRQLLDENRDQQLRFENLAKKALLASNENDAKVFLSKKLSLQICESDLSVAYDKAHDNANKMRQLHDKLTQNINSLKARHEAIRAKRSMAAAQDKVNKMYESTNSTEGVEGAFDRLEEDAGRELDIANAYAELNTTPTDQSERLAQKYDHPSSPLDDELEKLKNSLNL